MADLVDRQGLGLAQAALGIEGLFLEEAMDAVGRGQEVPLRRVCSWVEKIETVWVEGLDDLARPR
jgi:hypothetical protein